MSATKQKRDTSIIKVCSGHSPIGDMGQVYLASGVRVSMRLWHESPGEAGQTTRRNYETVGYVISGRAELSVESQQVVLEPGDSWVVPGGPLMGTACSSHSPQSRPHRRRRSRKAETSSGA